MRERLTSSCALPPCAGSEDFVSTINLSSAENPSFADAHNGLRVPAMVICPKSHSKTQNDSDSARNLRRILNWNYRRLGRDTRRNGLHLIGIVMYLCGFHLRIQKDAQALYYVVDRHILNSSPIRNQKLVCRSSPCFRVSVVLFVPLEIGFCWIPCRADQPEPIPIRKMRLLEHWHCRATVELQKRSRKRGDGKTSNPLAGAELRMGKYSRSRPNSKANPLSCGAIHD